MKKYIHITKEDRMFIMKALGVTERTVFNAIRFDSKRGDTELARKSASWRWNAGALSWWRYPK